MPWDPIQLNDGVCVTPIRFHPPLMYSGNVIPSIAFGTWTLGNGQGPIDQVDQAISVGFSHIGKHFGFGPQLEADSVRSDTAQAYRNEEEAGKAVRESGLARQDIFITTKYSGLNGLDIETSIQNSLKKVRIASLGCPQCCRSLITLLIAWS